MEEFETYLITHNYAPNTIASYLFAAAQLQERADVLTDQALLEHKEWLVTSFSAKTANNRIGAINVYLDYRGYSGVRLKGVKVQQKPFLDNVISKKEYQTLIRGLKNDNDLFWYFAIRYLACTGARVSELRCFEVQHVELGYMDLISKGNKLRRVYIPRPLRDETLSWCKQSNKTFGLLFCNEKGKALSTRGISLGLKRAALRYGVNQDVVYPHSFRHLFAKSFIERNPDIAFLADLMGHESIETTRIYLRRTASEQIATVDKTVNW